MTTTITITGTGTPVPTADRAGPGVLVSHDGLHMQFDAGRGTLGRLQAAGRGPEDLTGLFLTHYHSDHVVGVQDLVLSHWVMDSRSDYPPFTIYAPNGHTVNHCNQMLDIWQADLAVRSFHNNRPPTPNASVVGFDTPAAPTEVFARGSVRVLAGEVRHEPVEGAVGYRVETPDGAVAISGDTLVCDEVAALAEGVDVMVYEAMRMDVIRERPPERQFIMEYHACTREIGRQMAELDVPTLMLTHLIPAPTTAVDKQLFVDEVRDGGYTGEVIVCDDLDSVTLG